MALNKAYTFTNNTIADPAEENANHDAHVANVRAAHHRDADGTKISYQDIATGWGLVPSGGIMFWYSTIASIPTGYVFCNGANGTPDMRNRFAMCPGQDSGGTYDTGDVGGAATINLYHLHGTAAASTPDHLHLNSHGHYVTRVNDGSGYSESGHGLDTGGDFAGVTMNSPTHTGAADRSLSHSHGNTDSQLSAAQSVINPFKALAFIMKT